MSDNLPTILDAEAEIKVIQGEMADRSSSYWRGPDAPAKQARYRELVNNRRSVAQAQSGGQTILLPIEAPADFYAQMRAAGVEAADYDEYLARMRTAADVLYRIDEREQQAFVASFEALPDGVTDAAIEELQRRKPSVIVSDEDEVMHFARTQPAGAIVVREWGQDARRNHAVVKARLWRAIDNMEEHEAHRFMDWLGDLTPSAQAAIYWKLAA